MCLKPFNRHTLKLICIGWINNKVLLYSTGNYIQYPIINQNEKEYYKCIYSPITLLYTRNQHTTVNQLHSNTIKKKSNWGPPWRLSTTGQTDFSLWVFSVLCYHYSVFPLGRYFQKFSLHQTVRFSTSKKKKKVPSLDIQLIIPLLGH